MELQGSIIGCQETRDVGPVVLYTVEGERLDLGDGLRQICNTLKKKCIIEMQLTYGVILVSGL